MQALRGERDDRRRCGNQTRRAGPNGRTHKRDVGLTGLPLLLPASWARVREVLAAEQSGDLNAGSLTRPVRRTARATCPLCWLHAPTLSASGHVLTTSQTATVALAEVDAPAGRQLGDAPRRHWPLLRQRGWVTVFVSAGCYRVAVRMAVTERSTSASVVRQLDTEIRMRRWPCQVVAPIQHSPERCTLSMTRSVRSSSPKPTRT